MLYTIDTQQKLDQDLVHLELIVSNITCGIIGEYGNVYVSVCIYT